MNNHLIKSILTAPWSE